MKRAYLHLLAIIFCLSLMSCKSSQQAEKSNQVFVSVEDFNHQNRGLSTDIKAVIIQESVSISRKSLYANPWEYEEPPRLPGIVWVTTVEDKILLLEDRINNESFAEITYFYPRKTRWDPVNQCEMWLCSLDEKNGIQQRKISENEMIRERVNDSISKIQLNIKESVNGKILIRKYSLQSPYYAIPNVGIGLEFARMKPLTFQRSIPLLNGRYEILLPHKDEQFDLIENKVIKSGDGNIHIESENINVSDILYQTNRERNENSWRTVRKQLNYTYKAERVVITATNVMPLPQESNEPPLEVQFVIKGNRKK